MVFYKGILGKFGFKQSKYDHDETNHAMPASDVGFTKFTLLLTVNL